MHGGDTSDYTFLFSLTYPLYLSVYQLSASSGFMLAYLEDWEQSRTPTASDKDDACGEDSGCSEYTTRSA
jgi:hypothetical protein